jgi:hypothetical protein
VIVAGAKLGNAKRKQQQRGRPHLDRPVGPDVVAVIEAFAEATAGVSRRYVNIAESPIVLAYQRGKLHCGGAGREADQIAQSRLIASESFRVVFEASQAPGQTKFGRVSASDPRCLVPSGRRRPIPPGSLLCPPFDRPG